MHASWESTEVDDTVETVRGLSKSPPSHRGMDLIISPLAELLILFFYINFIGKTIINATLMIQHIFNLILLDLLLPFKVGTRLDTMPTKGIIGFRDFHFFTLGNEKCKMY